MEAWTPSLTSKIYKMSAFACLLTLLLLTISNIQETESRQSSSITSKHKAGRRRSSPPDDFEYSAISCRKHCASIADFGGVGDGNTSNTKAFAAAVQQLSQYEDDGGAILFVPAGKWLTGSFNVTSHFTLGRDAAGGRFISLIFGTNLTDVIITGENGTIDGQGEIWWQKFHKGKLKNTRPYLIEIMHSDTIQISNITLVNSPSWNIHPVYSSNILVQGITISAPLNSPNTDGINPDSCTNTRIEDCYIMSGDDCVAVKSGWDEYGIAYAMPTKHLVVRRLTCISPTSAVIALGSEMSGGIEDVRAEDIVAVDSESGVRIKTAVGRGGYVRDVYVKGMRLQTMKWVFWMTGNYGSHPDKKDVVAEDVKMAARLEGIAGDPFTEVCISNVTITLAAKAKKIQWACSDVTGVSSWVQPKPCGQIPEETDPNAKECDFPTDSLPIDDIQLLSCSSPIPIKPFLG
ncbi:hypothetical protein V2J09_014654 [Rumex salicifolius]